MPLTIEQMKHLAINSVPFAERTGMKIEVLEKGYVKIGMPLEPNKNHIGTMYAGALFTLAEIPGGALFMASFEPGKFYPIVKEFNIRFRRPAKGKIYVEARLSNDEIEKISTEAQANGKADYLLEENLIDESGEIVAIATGTYQARKIGT